MLEIETNYENVVLLDFWKGNKLYIHGKMKPVYQDVLKRLSNLSI